MKRIILILAILVNSSTLFAQMTMPKLYKQWMIEDINKGKYEKALSEFKQVDFTYYGDESDLSLDMSKFDEFAQYAFEHNITDEQKISIYHYLASMAFSYGDYTYSEKNYADAVTYYQLSTQYYSSIQQIFPLETVISYAMHGNALKELKLYDNAEKAYVEALHIIENEDADTLDIRHTLLNNLVDNSLVKGDTLSAEKYFLIDHPTTLPVDTSDAYSLMWYILGDYYTAKGELQKGTTYYNKTIEYYTAIHNNHQRVYYLWSASMNYWESQDTVSAKKYLDEAYQAAKSSNITDYPYQLTLSRLAYLHYELKDYLLSSKYCKELYDASISYPQEGIAFTQIATNGMMLNDIELGTTDDVRNDIQLGANVNSTQWNVQPLHQAIYRDIRKFMGADVDVTKNEYTELLLQSGAKTDAYGSDGDYGSDIETAIIFEDYRLCHLLMQYGASPKKLIHDDSMTALQYAESRGLKRFVELMRKPQSYSTRLTIQELDALYKRSHNQIDFDATERYCEQALSQYDEEIDESKYTGYRTRQQVLFYYVSAMVNNVSRLETEYLTSRDENIIKLAEQKLLKAIEFNNERKKYHDSNTFDLGYGDLDEKLIGLVNDRDGRLGYHGGVQIDALNQLKMREEWGVYDRYYWQVLAEAAHYYSVHSIKEPALELYRRLLRYMAETDNGIDSIMKYNYQNLIQDMAYLQATTEDTIALQKEFDRAKIYFIRDCGNDSLCYYSHLTFLGWHIIPTEEYKHYMAQYIALHSKNNTNPNYYDVQMLPILQGITELDIRDSAVVHEWTKDAEKLLPMLPYCQSSNAKRSIAQYWIITNYVLAHQDFLYSVNTNTKDTNIDLSYTNRIWDVVPIFFSSNKDIIQNRLSTMSSEMASHWLNSYNPFNTDQEVYLTINESEPPSNSIAAIYDNELFKKGLLLRNMDNMKRYLVESSDTTAIYLYNKIQSLKAEREKYRTQLFSDSAVTELTREIDNKERMLYNLSGTYKEQMSYENITWRDICSNLQENEVAIEFVNYGYIDQYFAMVLRKGYEYPKLVRLPDFTNKPKEEKDKLMEFYQQNLEFAREHKFQTMPQEPHFLEFVGDAGEIYKYEGNGTDLYNALWLPLKEYINEGDTVYFSPAGVLHQLSVEALPITETEVLADRYNLRRVSSTREIIKQSSPIENISSTILYGGIIYEVDKDLMEAESRSYKFDNTLAVRSTYDDGFDRGSASYLPGTKKEIDDISQMLKNKKIRYKIFTEDKANEESFKALSGKNQVVLHIATHGFFWSDSIARSQKYFSQRDASVDTQPLYIDPLTRCGLLFAGANLALRGHSNALSNGVQDGILTAKEISLLDLRDTKLVVLSACETGKGEITGDGVFGLQRAFKQAGVETIIMSLWKVNDTTTQMMMSKFYEFWLSGQDKRTAFYNAQKEIRKAYPSPFYWAGFIMLD